MKKEIQIDSSIYSKKQIEDTVLIFKEYGNISYNGDSICLEAESEDEIDELFGECMNYVLSV